MSPHPSMKDWRSIGWWFRDSKTGETVLFQPPNAPLAVFHTTTALRRFGVLPQHQRAIGLIRTGALVVWAFDELARGTTPIRRVLGAVTLASQVRRLVR